MASTAYIDEAFRDGPNGCYVVAAVLIDDDHADDLRQDLTQLFGGRRRRFHWHREAAGPRNRMLELIAAAHLPTRSVTKRIVGLVHQERARALCLERLLWELRQCDIHHAVLESRQARNNARDKRTIVAAQVTGKAAADLTYTFGLPIEEPLLWMADAIASAVASGIYSTDDTPLEVVASVLERVTL